MTRSLRLAAAAVVFGTLALGATAASAHVPHFGGHGGHHGGLHFGGKHFGGGWGYRVRPVYFGGCYLKSFIDIYGNPYLRKVCY